MEGSDTNFGDTNFENLDRTHPTVKMEHSNFPRIEEYILQLFQTAESQGNLPTKIIHML